ncbi:hypothetical protein BJV74DRAFT_286093 [Russula compacta]|nr:hypothetical protein BJV74DRAFT_286093 [Russula compacta]
MPTQYNSSTGTSPTPRRHPEYFFSEADTTFKAGNHIFRVHKRFFLRESTYFLTLFTSPAIPCNDPPGSSDTNPIVLKDTTSEAFAGLLWVFYNPKYSIYTATVDKWIEILALAQRWQFKEVEQLCIRELEKLSIPPVEKIKIYQDFKLDTTLLLVSFAQLTVRAEPLSLEEGQKLGIDTTLRIARARELARGTNSGTRPSAVQVQGTELGSLVQNVFGLEEAPFDFTVAHSFNS